MVYDAQRQERNAALLAAYARHFWTEDCESTAGASGATAPEATAPPAKPPPPCKVEAIVLPDARIDSSCPNKHYATEAYRVGDAKAYVALSRMWLAEPRPPQKIVGPFAALETSSRAALSGPFTVAFIFPAPGAHRVCRPERLELGGSSARLIWEDQADAVGVTDFHSRYGNAGLLVSGLVSSYSESHRGKSWLGSISCLWLGCNDRRSVHVEVRSLPSGLPILLDGARAYLTDESFWVAARRLRDIRVQMPTGVLKKLSDCRRARGANSVELFHC